MVVFYNRHKQSLRRRYCRIYISVESSCQFELDKNAQKISKTGHYTWHDKLLLRHTLPASCHSNEIQAVHLIYHTLFHT